MPTIEISGPGDNGSYTVEMESDDQEAQESAGGEGAGGEGAEDPISEGSEDGSGEGNSVTCGSVREVLQAVKAMLMEGSAPSPQKMWDQEAASRQSKQGAM